MNNFKVVGGIVALLLLLLISVKYIVSDKYTLTDVLPANEETKISYSELSEGDGINHNFSYSIWFYVNDWNYNYGNYKPIFGKYIGSDAVAAKGQSYIEKLETCHSDFGSDAICANLKPSPVVTFDKINNDILIFMSGNSEIFKCRVPNIALQKWVNLTISLYKKTLDVYINGKLAKTCVLSSVPNIDNTKADLYLSSGNAEDMEGFSGYTSKFRFYPNALNPQQVWDIYSNGYGNIASTVGDYNFKFSLLENGNVTNTWTL